MNGLSIVPIANLIHLSFHSRHIHDLSFVSPIACTNQYMYSFSGPPYNCIIRMYASFSCTLFHASFAFRHKFHSYTTSGEKSIVINK